MINFDYSKPVSVQAAVSAMAKDSSAQYIAGGTNLVDLMKRGVSEKEAKCFAASFFRRSFRTTLDVFAMTR